LEQVCGEGMEFHIALLLAQPRYHLRSKVDRQVERVWPGMMPHDAEVIFAGR